MPKAGLCQSPSLEEYPGLLVHQLPQQLLQDGVTGLVPGVNNQWPMEEVAWVRIQFLSLSMDCPSLTEKFSGMGVGGLNSYDTIFSSASHSPLTYSNSQLTQMACLLHARHSYTCDCCLHFTEGATKAHRV